MQIRTYAALMLGALMLVGCGSPAASPQPVISVDCTVKSCAPPSYIDWDVSKGSIQITANGPVALKVSDPIAMGGSVVTYYEVTGTSTAFLAPRYGSGCSTAKGTAMRVVGGEGQCTAFDWKPIPLGYGIQWTPGDPGTYTVTLQAHQCPTVDASYLACK